MGAEITYCKVKSFEIVEGEKVLKVEQFGIKTADLISAFGDDSGIPEGYTAIYAGTSGAGDKIIIGCFNKNQKAKAGEKRIFSLKPDGSFSTDIYLKDDGKMEIGGNIDNLVRYLELNSALQQEVLSINVELAKISTAIGLLGGSYVLQPITLNILQAKIDELLCP